MKLIIYNFKKARAYIKNESIEPREPNWANLSILLHDNETNYYKKIDMYQSLYNNLFYQYIYKDIDIDNTPAIQEIIIKNQIKMFLENTQNYLQQCDNIVEILITINDNNKIYNNLSIETIKFSNYKRLEPYGIPLEPSRLRFVSLEYTHPEMEKEITLKIPLNSFYIGNQILSAIFIKNILENQYEPYVFDNNYIINIIDMDFNFFTIKMGEYIEILDNEEKYYIKKSYE
jgi:hypothetical protein